MPKFMQKFIKNHIHGISGVFILLILMVSYTIMRPDTDDSKLIFCTQDAKQCPDGSYVGRLAPSCQFAECPSFNSPQGTSATSQISNTVTTLTSSLPKAHVTIRYTGLGFTPGTTTVTTEQIVDFLNVSNESFWPAYDPNYDATGRATTTPTNLYPEFDSQTAITPGNKFMFTFTKPGVWHFRNTLKDKFTGVVIVKEAPKAATSTPRK